MAWLRLKTLFYQKKNPKKIHVYWKTTLLTSASINQTGSIYASTHFRPGRAGIVAFGCELWDVLLLTMPWNTSQAFYSKDRSAFSPWCDTDAPQRGQYFQHQFLFLMKAGSCWWQDVFFFNTFRPWPPVRNAPACGFLPGLNRHATMFTFASAPQTYRET